MHRLQSTAFRCSWRAEHTFQPQHLPSFGSVAKLSPASRHTRQSLGFFLGWKWQSFSTFIIISFKSAARQLLAERAADNPALTLTDCQSVCPSAHPSVCLACHILRPHIVSPTHTQTCSRRSCSIHISLTVTHIHTQKEETENKNTNTNKKHTNFRNQSTV